MIQELINIRNGLIADNIFTKVFLGLPREIPEEQFLTINIIGGDYGAIQDTLLIEFRITDLKDTPLSDIYNKLDQLRQYLISNNFGYFTYEIGNIYSDYDNLGRPFGLIDIRFSKLILK